MFVIKRDLKENCFEHLHQFVSSTEHQNYVSEIEFSGRITCITSHLYITESNNNAICYLGHSYFYASFKQQVLQMKKDLALWFIVEGI